MRSFLRVLLPLSICWMGGRQMSLPPALLPGSPAWVSKSPRAYSPPHLGSSPCTRRWGQMARFSGRRPWHGSQIGVFQFLLLPGAECSSAPTARACCSGPEPSAAAGHTTHPTPVLWESASDIRAEHSVIGVNLILSASQLPEIFIPFCSTEGTLTPFPALLQMSVFTFCQLF